MPNKIPKDAHAMIIGAMKCGTGSLYSYLSGHPQICPAITKEPEFFSENQGHGVEIENYKDLFFYDDSIHKYTLDGSTGYTKYPSEPNVPKNIYVNFRFKIVLGKFPGVLIENVIIDGNIIKDFIRGKQSAVVSKYFLSVPPSGPSGI